MRPFHHWIHFWLWPWIIGIGAPALSGRHQDFLVRLFIICLSNLLKTAVADWDLPSWFHHYFHPGPKYRGHWHTLHFVNYFLRLSGHRKCITFCLLSWRARPVSSLCKCASKIVNHCLIFVANSTTLAQNLDAVRSLRRNQLDRLQRGWMWVHCWVRRQPGAFPCPSPLRLLLWCSICLTECLH